MILSPARSIQSSPARQHGQSAVEMAVLLPVILILLMGVIMTGFMLFAFIQVSNAAREGARAGSIFRLTRTETGYTNVGQAVRQAIYDPGTGDTALGYLNPTSPSFNINSDVSVALTDVSGLPASQSDPQPGDRLSVTIKYSYTLPILSAMLPVFPQPVVIDRTVVMEIQ